MSVKYLLPVLTMLVAITIAGCQQPEAHPSVIEPAPSTLTTQTIAISTLADRLGLKIVETTPAYMTLKNSANTVMIFTGTQGRFFVNGQEKGSVGTVEKVNGQIYVSESISPMISAELRTVAPQPLQPQYQPKKTCSGTVIIDSGHGGKDPGTIGRNGAYEKSINLAVARNVAALLKQRGVNVILTRSDDTFVELDGRAEVANRSHAQLFVSIHTNSCGNKSDHGFTVYTSRSASGASESLAQSIIRAMPITGLASNGLQHADYRVLVDTRCPAALVEVGYLSNSRESALLVSDGFQNRIAEAIAQGIYYAL